MNALACFASATRLPLPSVPSAFATPRCCAKTPVHLVPLLNAARDALRPHDIGVQSMQHQPPTVSVTISRDEGATADDCATASRTLSDLFDTHFGTAPYTLLVSSPGVAETLDLSDARQLAAFKGFPIRVCLVGDAKDIVGRLGDVDFAGDEEESGSSEEENKERDMDECIEVNIRGRMKKVLRANVESITLCTTSDLE